MKLLQTHSGTLLGLVIGGSILAISLIFQLDFLELLHRLEKYEVDELIIPLGIVLVGILFDHNLARHRHQVEIRDQRLRVMKATMRTVQHIVNNFLNCLHLLGMNPEAPLSAQTKTTLNDLIQKTAAELKKIDSLEDTPEKTVVGATWIDYDCPRET